MILCMDVGNTNIVIGVFDADGHLHHHWRMHTNKHQTEDEYGLIIRQMIAGEGLKTDHVQGIIISSVVPSLMSVLEKMCHQYFGLTPVVVGPGIKTKLPILYDNPREVGADRIVNAVAALDEHAPPLIIIDFGTATTFCYVNEKGEYVGGAISPGIYISTEALYHYASKLPRVNVAFPEQVIGRNTVQAMQSGILNGYVGQVEYMVKQIKETCSQTPHVIATGGFAELIAQKTTVVDAVHPYLTLNGLYRIYMLNRGE